MTLRVRGLGEGEAAELARMTHSRTLAGVEARGHLGWNRTLRAGGAG